MSTLETKRLAKAVCKQLLRLIPHALEKRPREPSGYTILQAQRTAMTLSIGACLNLGMSEDELRAAMEATLEGYRAYQAAHGGEAN